MPKYLLQVSYTPEGLKGVLSKGGSAREGAARELCESVGGTLECMYFAFGDTDVYAIADLPDNQTATAVALAVGASGGAGAKTTVLMTPADVDGAAKKSITYRPANA
jgi:uncharacterized protein with GYD domain